MRRLAQAVTVVTTRDGDEIAGITVSSFISVSLEPTLVLISIDKDAPSYSLIEASGIFAVNILREDQRFLADLFAARYPETADPFSKLSYRNAVTGAPILEGGLGFLDCRVRAVHPEGDHTVFVGDVVAVESQAGRPLLYRDGHYFRLGEEIKENEKI